MPKYSVTIAATVRAYAVIEIDAADEDAAWTRAQAIALLGWSAPEMKDAVFDPAWDTLDDFEALEDIEQQPGDLRRLVTYTFYDGYGGEVETATASAEDASSRAAAFMLAQASEGLSGRVEFLNPEEV